MITKKNGTKVTFKQFLKQWAKGIKKVKLFKDIKKETRRAIKLYGKGKGVK